MKVEIWERPGHPDQIIVRTNLEGAIETEEKLALIFSANEKTGFEYVSALLPEARISVRSVE